VTAQPPAAGRTLDADAGADLLARPRDRLEPSGRAPRRRRAGGEHRRAGGGGRRRPLAPRSPGRTSSGRRPCSLSVAPQDVAPLLSMAAVADGPVLTLDTAALRAVVAARAAPLATRPRSAGFSVVGAAPSSPPRATWLDTAPAQVAVRPGTAGREVDVDAATARLRALVADRRPAAPQPLPLRTVEPPLTTAQAEAARRPHPARHLHDLLPGRPARATEHPPHRRARRRRLRPAGRGAQPQRRAGRRTAARGFVADGAIVDGVLTDEVGGGVSQFATTLFNAAFFAGLPILEHKPHSFYISRYPAGRESTVYYGAIDVKVRNDTAPGCSCAPARRPARSPSSSTATTAVAASCRPPDRVARGPTAASPSTSPAPSPVATGGASGACSGRRTTRCPPDER
jgi:hypothetical protein